MPDNKNPFKKLFDSGRARNLKKSTPVKDITSVGSNPGATSTILDNRFANIAKKNGWNISSMSDTNMEAQAYLDQDGWDMTKNMVSGFGKQAVAGFIDSIAAYDMVDQYNMVKGNTNQKFGNYLTDLSKSIRDSEQLENPIYQNGDDMFNSAYWMNQFKNQGYTAGIMLEGMAEQALLTYATAQTGGTTGAGQLAVLSSWGARLNKLNTLKYAVQGSVKGVQEAYINALETQDQVYNRYKDLGYTEEKAIELAGKAAAIGYKTEIAPSMIMNAMQYGAIAKYNPFMKGGVDTGYSGFLNSLSEALVPKFANKTANAITGYGLNMLAEGVEEGIQTAIGEFAGYSIDRQEGLTGGKTISDYLMSTEMRDSIVGGIIGGGMFKGMHDVRSRLSGTARNQNRQEALVNESVDTFMSANAERLVDGLNRIKTATESNKQYEVDKAKRDFNIDNSLSALHLDYIQGKDLAFNSHVDLMNTVLNAANEGNQEVLNQYGLTTQEDVDNVKNNFPILIEEALKTRESLIKNIGRTRSYEVAEKLTKYEAAMGIFQNSIQDAEIRRNELLTDPNYTSLNNIQTKIVQRNIDKAIIENKLIDSNISEEESNTLKEDLNSINSEINSLNNEFETTYPGKAKTHLQYNAQELFENSLELDNYNSAYNSLLTNYNNLTNPKNQRRLEKNILLNKSLNRITRAENIEDLNSIESDLESNNILNRNLKKEISKKKQSLNRQEVSGINEDKSESRITLDSILPSINLNIDSVKSSINNNVNKLKSKFNIPDNLSTPKFIKNLANSYLLLEDKLINTITNNQSETINNNNEENIIEESDSNKVPNPSTVGNNVAPILEEIEEVLSESPTQKDIDNVSEPDTNEVDNSSDELPTDKMEVLFKDLSIFENDDFMSPLFVEDSMIPKLGKLVKTLYNKYEAENNYKPNFRQFITFAIDNSGYGKVDIEKIYDGLKEGWLYNNYPSDNFNDIYNIIFSETKDLFSDIFDIMNIRATENPESNSDTVIQMNVIDKVETEKNDKGEIIEKPNQKITLNNGEKVDRKRIITTSLHALYQSLPASFIKDENGGIKVVENSKQILNDSGFIDSKQLLDNTIANKGDILSVKIPDNFENLPVQVYDNDGYFVKSIPFSNFIIENNYAPDTLEYLENIPMLAYSKDGTPLFQIKNSSWYNSQNYGKENHPEYQQKEIQEAKRKLFEFRNTVLNNYNSNNTGTDIQILDKTNGFYNTIPNDMPLRSLDEVLPHGTFLLGDESGNLIDTDGKVVYQNGDKRVNMFKGLKPETVKSGFTYISTPSANNETDFVFYLNKTKGIKNQDTKNTILKVVETYLTSVENMNDDSTNILMQKVSDDFGIDMASAEDVDNFLSRFLIPFNKYELLRGKEPKEFSSIISAYMNTATYNKNGIETPSYEDGSMYYTMQNGTFYIGRVRSPLNNGSDSTQNIIYLHPQAGDLNSQKPAYKGLVSSIINMLSETLDTSYHNINKKALKKNINGKKIQMFNITDSNEVIATGQSYEQYLRTDALVTNLISYNIGTSENPKYVVGVQPSITFKGLGNVSGQNNFNILEPNSNAFSLSNEPTIISTSTKSETTMLNKNDIVIENIESVPEITEFKDLNENSKGPVIFNDSELIEAENKFEQEESNNNEIIFNPEEVSPIEVEETKSSYVGNNVYDTLVTQINEAGINFKSNPNISIQPTLSEEIIGTVSLEIPDDNTALLRFTENATVNDILNAFIQINLYLNPNNIENLKSNIENINGSVIEDSDIISKGMNIIAGLASGKNGVRDIIDNELKLNDAETISSTIFNTNYSNLITLTDKLNINYSDYNFLGNTKKEIQTLLPTDKKSNDVEVTVEEKLIDENLIPKDLALNAYKTLKEFGIEDKNPAIQILKNSFGKMNNDNFGSIDFTDIALTRIRESENINEHLNHTQENELVDYLYAIANNNNVTKPYTSKDVLEDSLKDSLEKLILDKKTNIKNLIEQFQSLEKDGLDNILNLLFDKLKALDYILKNNDDIVNKSVNKFIKLNSLTERNEEISEDEDGLNITNDSDEHIQDKNYSKTSLEENSKSSASVKLKSFFKLIEDVTKTNQSKAGFLGVQKYLGFDEIWDGIQQVMATPTEVYSDFGQMLNRIQSHIPSKPWLSQVYDKLSNADEQTKNEFTYLFARHLLSMKFVMYSKNRDNGYTLKVYDTNSNDIIRVLQDNWRSNLNASELLEINSETGDYQLNVDKANELLERFKNFTSLNKQVSNNDLLEWLREFGINLSNETIQEIRTKGAYYNGERLDFSGHFNQKSNTPGIFGLLANYLKTSIDSNDLVIDSDNNNHPFSNANNSLKTLSTIESKYTMTSVTNSFRDGDKSIYGYTPSKYATDAVFKLVNEQEYRDKFSTKAYSKNSLLLKLLNSNENFRSKFSIDHIGITSFKEFGKKIFGDNNIVNLSSSDHEATKLGFFQDMKQGDVSEKIGDKGSIGMRMSRMFFPTMSDKSQMLTLSTGVLDLRSKHLFDKVNKEVKPTDEVINVYYEQVAKNELDRIINFVSKIGSTNIKDYDFASQMFLAHPYLNAIEIDYNDKRYNILELLNSVSLMNEDTINNIVNNLIEPAIKNKLSESLIRKVDDKINEWKDLGFVQDDKIRIFDSSYLAKFKDTNSSIDDILKMSAYDFIINNQISLSNIFMLIGGDLASYAKKGLQRPFEDKPWIFKEDYETNLSNEEKYSSLIKGDNLGINLGKRLAILLAPGSKLSNSRGYSNDKYTYDKDYIQLFLSDFETVTKNFDFLISLYYGDNIAKQYSPKVEQYFKSKDNVEKSRIVNELAEKFPEISDYLTIEATDAQEYTTSKEHLDVLFRQGRLTDSDYNKMINKINNQFEQERKGEKISNENLLTDNELKLIMQPIKPVYTGLIEDKNYDIMRMMYIKTSSFPLLPQVTIGTELNGLRKTMELAQFKSGKNIRASYDTGNKVGSITKSNALNVFNVDGTFNNEIYDNLNQDNIDFKETFVGVGSLVLERDNFRIQQDVPPKFAKRNEDVVSLGSQVMKLLFGDGIIGLDGFNYNNSSYDGKQLYDKYNENWFKLLDLKKKSLYDELGLNDKGIPINEEETAVYLRNLLEREAIDRGYPQQDIDALKLERITDNGVVRYDFTVPLWLSPNSNRYESLLNAIVTNRLTKIKMPGNSYVAGSETGFKMSESLDNIDTSKIIYTNNYTGELQPYKDGNIAQVFLPSRFRDNNGKLIEFINKDGNYNTKYVTKDDSGRLRLLDNMISKELLSLSSFRIPTSSHVSMSQVEIVGLLPTEVGDLMIVPQNFGVQKGLDYDVDKENTYHLYTYTDKNGVIRPFDESAKENILQEAKNKLLNIKGSSNKQREIADNFFKLMFGEDVNEWSTSEFASNDKKIEALSKKLDEKIYKNELVKIHSSVLSNTNPEVQQKINKVLSMDIAKLSASIIDSELTSENNSTFSLFDDNYQKHKMELGSSGKLGISVYSNYVVLHSMLKQVSDTGNEIRLLEEYINENSKTAYRNLELNISGIVSDGVLGKTKLTESDRFISEIMAERQNTATDNEKEQIMGKVNINEFTINFDSIMTLLGYDLININSKNKKVSLSYLILSQPIIKEYVAKLKESKSTTNETFLKNSEEDVFETLYDELYTRLSDNQIEKLDNTDFSNLTGDKLFNNLKNSDAFTQIKVLELFKMLNNQAKTLTKVQQSLNTTKGLGKSFFEVIEKRNALIDVYNNRNKIQNIEKLIGNFTTFGPAQPKETKNRYNDRYFVGEGINDDGNTFDLYVEPTNSISKMTVSTIDAGYNLWSKYFPYENEVINYTVKKLSEYRGIGSENSSQLVNMRMQILSEMKKYLYSNGTFTNLHKGISSSKVRKDLFVDTKENESIANYLNKVVQLNDNDVVYDSLISNRLISRFKYKIETNGSPSTIIFDNTVGEQFEEEYLYSSIPSLIVNNKQLPDRNNQYYDTRMLAVDLITYNYVQGGIQGATEFSKYIPISVLEAIGFANNTRRFTNPNSLNDNFIKAFGNIDLNGFNNFIKQMVQHNPQSVTRVELENLRFNTKHYKDLNSASVVVLNESKIDSSLFDYYLNQDFISVYNPKIKKGRSKFMLYMQLDKIKQPGIFTRIDVLGGNGINEYQYQNNDTKTIINDSYSKDIFDSLDEVNRNTKDDSNANLNTDFYSINTGDIIQVLNNIEKSSNLYHSELAKFLNQNVDFRDLNIEVVDNIDNFEGTYKPNENTIQITKETLNDSSKIERVILHETIHAATVHRLMKYIGDLRTNNPQFKVPNDELPSDIKDIVFMYRTSLSLKDEILDKLNTKESRERVNYALSELAEFITGVMTDSSMQEAMKDIKYQKSGMSLFDKFAQILVKLFNSIGLNSLANNSILKDSILASFELIKKQSIENNTDTNNEYTSLVSKVSELNKQIGGIDSNINVQDNFESIIPNNVKFKMFGNFPLSNDTRKSILNGTKILTIRQIEQNNASGYYTLDNGKEFLFSKVENRPINISSLYEKGYTQEYILNSFGVNSISDINDISVKNWFEGKNEKNVFVIKESKTFFSKDYSQSDINKIPTCK